MDQSNMITLYSYDERGYLIGVGSYEPKRAVPALSTELLPPVPAGGQVPRFVDGAWVLADPAVLVAPYAEPITKVTMRQARLELLERGLLDDVGALILAAGRVAQIEWEYAATVERGHPVIAQMQQQQGMTDAQVDDLFREAAQR